MSRCAQSGAAWAGGNAGVEDHPPSVRARPGVEVALLVSRCSVFAKAAVSRPSLQSILLQLSSSRGGRRLLQFGALFRSQADFQWHLRHLGRNL